AASVSRGSFMYNLAVSGSARDACYQPPPYQCTYPYTVEHCPWIAHCSPQGPCYPPPVCTGGYSTHGGGGAIWAERSLVIDGGTYTHNTSGGGSGRGTVDAELGHAAMLAAVGGDLSVKDATIGEAPPYPMITSGHAKLERISVLYAYVAVRAQSIHAEDSEFIGNGLVGLQADAEVVAIRSTVSGGPQATGVWGEEVELRNATLVGNDIAVNAPKRAVLEHATIVGARRSSIRSSKLSARASVVLAAGTEPVCEPGTVVEASSYNWFGDASCALSGVGDHQGANDNFSLGELSDNGGPVLTVKPAFTSALVDVIPASACTLETDARGVARPQSSHCDIGAVEVEPPSGNAPTDLAVRFVSGPAQLPSGQQASASWEIVVANHGSQPAVPALVIDALGGAQFDAVTATGASCSTGPRATCTWQAFLAPGAETRVLVSGTVQSTVTSTLLVRAELIGGGRAAPFTDDAAEFTTALGAPASRLSFSYQLSYQSNVAGLIVFVVVKNESSADAVTSRAQPIAVRFDLAPGVQADGYCGEVLEPIRAGGTYSCVHVLSASATPSALVGSLVLNPGVNAVVGPAKFDFYHADIELSADRAAGVQVASTPTTFQIHATNHGLGAARNILVTLDGPVLDYTFRPSRGVVAPWPFTTYNRWTIAALEPGETATLEVSVPYALPETPTYMSARLESAVDFYVGNNWVNMNMAAAAQGTADLRISDLEVTAGANADSRVVTASIVNDGAASIPARVSISGAQFIATSSRAVALTSNWVCDTSVCDSNGPMAAGESASVRFEVSGDFSNPLAQVDVYVSGTTHDIPDPHMGNNHRLRGTSSAGAWTQ
ncbi:MAG TPA: choice-of-anchor Q domain-containing protein, partial [Polyangiaceae bacterium]|nr:choice-of-anchor Q domain-containing protein [Polyangiaceae bacterium]